MTHLLLFQAAESGDAESGFGGFAWLGQLHPVLLHLPIGALAVLLLVELMTALTREPAAKRVRRWTLYFAAATSFLAALTGWILGHADGEPSALVERHELWGIGLMAILIAAALHERLHQGKPLAGTIRSLCLIMACLAAVGAGHLGGTLSHGRGHLADGAPAWFADLVAVLDEGLLPAVPPPATGAGTEVGALLERTCYECHGPDKQKGKLRLDTADGLASTLTPGDPLASELLYRVTLPPGDEDVMPPEDPLTPAEIGLLLAWVQAGAPMGEVEEQQSSFREERREERDLLGDARAASGARIAPAVGWSGAEVEQFAAAHGGAPLVVDYSLGEGALPADALTALAPIAPRVVELSLAGRRPATAAFATGIELPALRRLHLERSGFDTAQLAALAAAGPELAYLNLHSTAADDALIDGLAERSSLRRVVLYGTTVSPEGLARLADALPAAQLTADLRLPPEVDADRRILAADASTGRIALLREQAIGAYEVLWEHPIEAIHDLQRTPQGTVLFQDSWTRLLEVDPGDGSLVWSFDVAAALRAADGDGPPLEVHSFGRLLDGNTFVAVSGRQTILIVAADGRILRRVPLQVDVPDAEHENRLVRPTPDGTFLVAHERDGVVREYGMDGTVVWEYAVPLFGRERAPGSGHDAWGNQVFGVLRRADGNTLITTGNGHSLLEVDRAGELVWSLTEADLPGIRLAWTTVVEELPNGNLLLGNCHADPLEPQLLEVTRDKQLVWTFCDRELFGDGLANATVWEGPLGAH